MRAGFVNLEKKVSDEQELVQHVVSLTLVENDIVTVALDNQVSAQQSKNWLPSHTLSVYTITKHVDLNYTPIDRLIVRPSPFCS